MPYTLIDKDPARRITGRLFGQRACMALPDRQNMQKRGHVTANLKPGVNPSDFAAQHITL